MSKKCKTLSANVKDDFLGQAKSKQLWLKSQKDNVSLMFLNENNRGIESTNRKCGLTFIIDKVYFFQFGEFFDFSFIFCYLTMQAFNFHSISSTYFITCLIIFGCNTLPG